MPRPTPRRTVVLGLVLVVLLATIPGGALAAPVQGVGGTIVVAEDETVDGISALGGTVVVRGTVTGDVNIAAGSLLVTGVVEGDVSGAAGAVDVRGRVDGDVNVGTGSLLVGEDAVIGGDLNAGAGSADLAGTVRGDATIGGGDIVLRESATFERDLRYDGDLTDEGATVEGRLIRDTSLSTVSFEPAGGFVSEAVLDVYGFLVSLVVGLVLLAALPARSRRLARRVVDEPLVTGLYGLGVLIGVPVVLVLVGLTIIGIPIAVIGAFLFAVVAWIGTIYGRYAVGEWLLGYGDVDNRWAALVVGMVVVAFVGLVPWLGTLVGFVVLLLGLGGMASLVLEAYRGRGEAVA